MKKKQTLFVCEDWKVPNEGTCELVASAGGLSLAIPLVDMHSKRKGTTWEHKRDYEIQTLDDNSKWITFSIPESDDMVSILYNLSKIDEDGYHFDTRRNSIINAWFIDKNGVYEERITGNYVSWGLFKFLSCEEGDRSRNPKNALELDQEDKLIELARKIAQNTATEHDIAVRSDFRLANRK